MHLLGSVAFSQPTSDACFANLPSGSRRAENHQSQHLVRHITLEELRHLCSQATQLGYRGIDKMALDTLFSESPDELQVQLQAIAGMPNDQINLSDPDAPEILIRSLAAAMKRPKSALLIP